jgi:hypothetical protein
MTSEKESVGALAVLALIGIPATIAITAIFDGYALSVLWRWFIVKQFSLPELSIPAAIGIGLVVSDLTHQFPPDVEEKDRDATTKLLITFGKSIGRPLFLLLIGSIVKSFL